MKVLRLTAENVKRLKVVDITPDATMQIVTGRNAQGKSSVLDALWLALGGGKASKDTTAPIREGEDTAQVSVDLGQLRVTRRWRRNQRRDVTTSLEVMATDGVRYRTPQAVLDELVGTLSFDPLAFTRLKPVEQRQALLDLVGLDFTVEDQERQRLYNVRLETGRRAHAFGDLPKLAPDAPVVEVSSTPIVARMKTAQEQAEAIRRRESSMEHLRSQVRQGRDRVAEITAEIERLEEKRRQLEDDCANWELALTVAEGQAALPQPESLDDLQVELAKVEETNRLVRTNQQVLKDREAQAGLQIEYTRLTHEIEAIDVAKARALKAVVMPVEGLGFDDTGVTFREVPFGQASSAEQIRVSLGMAMALNPTLRVVRIMDGSLLDDESMTLISSMAAEQDFQVWMERVDDDSLAAIVIEDGAVA